MADSRIAIHVRVEVPGSSEAFCSRLTVPIEDFRAANQPLSWYFERIADVIGSHVDEAVVDAL